jgi:hypothetical protein
MTAGNSSEPGKFFLDTKGFSAVAEGWMAGPHIGDFS